MVPVTSIIFMVIAGFVSVAIPVGLCIYFRVRKKADLLPFFVGCGVMILFAFVLEQIVHSVVLSSAAGSAILSSNWKFALYGGIMAALFEETGRLLAFLTVLKKKRDKDVNALMYGAGHGGIEAFLILGIASLNNVIYAVLINSGNAALLTNQVPEEVRTQVESAIQTLISTPSPEFLLGALERIFAVALHISLSVLVWFAVKKAGRRYLFAVALFLHFFVDAVTAALMRADVSLIIIECFIFAVCVVAVILARYVWSESGGQVP